MRVKLEAFRSLLGPFYYIKMLRISLIPMERENEISDLAGVITA